MATAQKSQGTTSVVLVGDLHINSTIALSLPSIELDDGGIYHASRTQRWLWACWLDFWSQIANLPGRKIGIFNGDLGELDVKRRSNQLITANKATILRHAIEVLSPALSVLDGAIIIRGTLAHVGKSSWLEEALANDIDIAIRPDGMASWYHLRTEIEGVRLDVAHHASMGQLPWTERDAANKVAKIIAWRYAIDLKQPLPHVAVRSHNHRYADSGHNYDVFAVCLPAWSALTEYGYRMGKENSMADIGGVWLICQNGSYQFGERRYRPEWDKRIWKLKI